MRRLRVRVNMSARRSGCVLDDGEGGGGGANIRVGPASGGSGDGGRRPSGSMALAEGESITCTGTMTGAERTCRTGMGTTTAVESSGVVAGDPPVVAPVAAGATNARSTRLTLGGPAPTSSSTDACTAPCMLRCIVLYEYSTVQYTELLLVNNTVNPQVLTM